MLLLSGDKFKKYRVLSLWPITFQTFTLPVFIHASKSEDSQQEQEMCIFKVLSAVTIMLTISHFFKSTNFTPENDIIYYFQGVSLLSLYYLLTDHNSLCSHT